jgi:hypothetical protein
MEVAQPLQKLKYLPKAKICFWNKKNNGNTSAVFCQKKRANLSFQNAPPLEATVRFARNKPIRNVDSFLTRACLLTFHVPLAPGAARSSRSSRKSSIYSKCKFQTRRFPKQAGCTKTAKRLKQVLAIQNRKLLAFLLKKRSSLKSINYSSKREK